MQYRCYLEFLNDGLDKLVKFYAPLLFRLLSTSSVIARKLDSHAYPPFKLPSSKNSRWIERQPFNKLYEYTTDPLPFPRTGGRGPNGMYVCE